jgi:HEPN domain-containing protein
MINEHIKKWLIKAIEDFRVAKHELRFPDEEIVTGAVCFHCQQLVEKLLKAYLASKNTNFPKTHNIFLLLELCAKLDKDFEKLDVGNLTFYAIEIRYTDDFYTASIEEAKECFEIASTAKDFILRKLDVKEGEI